MEESKRLIDLSADEARIHFLKGSSYFNNDFPSYLDFEPILNGVRAVLAGNQYGGFKSDNPANYPGVNYSFLANKDGRFGWRPYELMHPVMYVSLVNLICHQSHWEFLQQRFSEFEASCVECCSIPVVSTDDLTDQASQVRSWWQGVEQKSLVYSLDYTHLLHTDVTDCYGSLYTHSIAWALHGVQSAKAGKGKNSLIGNKIDRHIQSSRYGQTNGISQGSVLMDFVAEIVLGYVDEEIAKVIGHSEESRILRYRDDYRIFSNSDQQAEKILKTISDSLRDVGMRLGGPKTFMSTNVVEGSVKPDKLAGIELQDLGDANAKTIQKQLLRLHRFGRRFPNSGALRRLVGELHTKLANQRNTIDDLEISVQVAIATDIAAVSPQTFPAVAGILSYLISLAPKEEKVALWESVHRKMARIPYNGYLEVWLQRVTKPLGIPFSSQEPICQIVDGANPNLWENEWIANKTLKSALDVSKIIVGSAPNAPEVIDPKEVELFNLRAEKY